MRDRLLDAKECERCGGGLAARTTSWFTEETICMDCSEKESVVKARLREAGELDAWEGCGYVPEGALYSSGAGAILMWRGQDHETDC